MNKHIYLAAIALCATAFAQDQNPNPNPAPPRQNQPAPGINQRPTPDAAPKTSDRITQGISNLMGDWRLEELPQAVQKTIREQAGAGQKIADIDREDRTGRTVWEVEFEREGRNTEIHVGEDGTLVPEENRLFGRSTDPATTRPGERTPAAGTPAGTQTGRSVIALAGGTRWEDLPKAVQDKASVYGGKEKVADIDREERNGKVAYEIEFRREGRNLEMLIGEDGNLLESNDPNAKPAQGSAPNTEAGRTPSLQPNQPKPLPTTQPQAPRNQNSNPNPPPQ